VITLIGWDAAVDPRNNALVRASFGEGDAAGPVLAVDALRRPRNGAELVGTIAGWSRSADQVVICADSPLGWPVGLGMTLASHRAGAAVPLGAEALFRRHTDRDIRRRVGKTPLDVGADRIARTALTVLNVLSAVGESLPVDHLPVIALETTSVSAVRSAPSVIVLETYPAGWFASEGIVTRGYRPPAGEGHRRALLSEAREAFSRSGASISSEIDDEAFVKRADDLDALICVFAGVDALRGLAPGPPDDIRADVAVEGWIWCKDPI
jgi:hypothetical protein